MYGYIIVSLDNNGNPYITLSFSFQDHGIHDGRVGHAITCLLYLQMLEKDFELSNDANNEIVVVSNRLSLYFTNVIMFMIINYL